MRTQRIFLASACVGLIAAGCFCEFSRAASAQPPSRPGEYLGDFSISQKVVIPDMRYIARFRVLGAEISAGGDYDMPVTVEVRVGSDLFTPFGPYTSPTTGNVNDDNHPKDFILPQIYNAGTAFTIRGQSWSRDGGAAGETDADWKTNLSVGSSEQSANLLVLRNGDPVPEIEPFLNQQEIGDIVRDYVDPLTNTIRLWEDEVIYLFELGTTNLDSSAADFQDLVVLVTLAEDPVYFDRTRIQPNALFD